MTTSGHGTLFGLPRRIDGQPADIVIVGIPFDTGQSPRVGSRLGPDHIRSSFASERRHLIDVPGDPMRTMRVVDMGDVSTFLGDIERTHSAVDAVISDVLASGALPVALGGDGSVTLPQLRAVCEKYGRLAVIHCDAHTDAYETEGLGRYNTGSTFLRAQEEGLIEQGLTFHVGVRGTVASTNAQPGRVRALGQHVLTMDHVSVMGVSAAVSEIRAAIGDRPTFLSWDMDFFDPAVAPGVATPEWGGATAAEGIAFMRALAGLNIVAIDLTTVSPPHDVQGMSGNLAARMLLEALHVVALRFGSSTAQ